MKHAKRLLIGEVPDRANVISSRTVYKIKVEEDIALRRKARIVPHGNENSLSVA